MSRLYRLAYLISHPIQYQAPMLRYIAAHQEIDLTVFFMSDLSVRDYQDPGFKVSVKWDIPLLEGYRYVFLPVMGGKDRISFWQPFVYGLWRHLKSGRFDALWVNGYFHQVYLRAIAIAKMLGIKILFRCESHLKSQSRSWIKMRIKNFVLPRFFKAIDAFLAIGTLNRDYYLHYGVPKEHIFLTPYAVDNVFFQKKAIEARPHRETLRAELGLEPGRPVILFASKFQPHKRARDLLEAYIHLSSDGFKEPHPYLLFIGDGEERLRLETRAKELNWSSVRFLGFKNQTEIPQYYDLCDVFVLPSDRENWGLVINEVMNAGKPVIISDQVGCGPDLVEDGVNGFIVPVGDVPMLADRLRCLVNNPGLAARMGEESLRRISMWDFEAGLHGLLQALRSVVR